MDTDQLWRDHMAKARWFQGKGLDLGDVSITGLDWYANTGDLWVRSEIATANVGQRSQTYHLLVGYAPEGQGEPEATIGQCHLEGRGLVDVLDAPKSPQAMRAFLHAATSGNSGFTWYRPAPDPDSPTIVHTGEQSNTTVRIGDDVLLKIFRRLSPFPHPEAITLLGLSSSGITPEVIGTWADAGWDLGMFCERIPDAHDGWAYVTKAAASDRGIADQMRELGTTLRTLHTSMADVYGTATIASSVIETQMMTRLDKACERFPELMELRDGLAAALTAQGGDVPIQRIHGDFHLAQALISPRGWTIIDFEGEPLKPPEERTAPDCVWRDVAGLLRSLDYARYSHPDPSGPQARQWYVDGRLAFLDGYTSGSNQISPLLTAYEIDKAIYEYTYEVRNRPTWAPIPRNALLVAAQERKTL